MGQIAFKRKLAQHLKVSCWLAESFKILCFRLALRCADIRGSCRRTGALCSRSQVRQLTPFNGISSLWWTASATIASLCYWLTLQHFQLRPISPALIHSFPMALCPHSLAHRCQKLDVHSDSIRIHYLMYGYAGRRSRFHGGASHRPCYSVLFLRVAYSSSKGWAFQRCAVQILGME